MIKKMYNMTGMKPFNRESAAEVARQLGIDPGWLPPP